MTGYANLEQENEAVIAQPYNADWLLTLVNDAVPNSIQGAGVNIMIIDTPAYLDHPSFKHANIREVWEFITTDDGVKTYPRQESVNSEGHLRMGGSLNEKFAAHGTAIMGMLCANVAEVELKPGNYEGLSTDDDFEETLVELPGLGLAQNSNIYLVALSFDSQPDPYLGAFKKVTELVNSGGDWVIVMPRGIPRPADSNDSANSIWENIDSEIISLAKKTPFFYAAGNGQETTVTYPGSLFDGENRSDLMFSVGSRNSNNALSSYTALADIYCWSDDAEGIYRNDKGEDIYYLNRLNTDHYEDPVRKLKSQDSDFIANRVITTDVPGVYGYNPSSLKVDHYPIEVQFKVDPVSLFCEFGGTSAAAAVAAAIAARGLSSGAIDLSDAAIFRHWVLEKTEG